MPFQKSRMEYRSMPVSYSISDPRHRPQGLYDIYIEREREIYIDIYIYVYVYVYTNIIFITGQARFARHGWRGRGKDLNPRHTTSPRKRAQRP
jgi:hypothetical protein